MKISDLQIKKSNDDDNNKEKFLLFSRNLKVYLLRDGKNGMMKIELVQNEIAVYWFIFFARLFAFFLFRVLIIIIVYVHLLCVVCHHGIRSMVQGLSDETKWLLGNEWLNEEHNKQLLSKKKFRLINKI